MKKRSYSITVDDQLVIINITGGLGIEEVQSIRGELEAISTENHEPVDILTILQSIGTPSVEAMREAVRLLDEVPLHRVAVVGVKPDQIRGTSMVFKVIGNDDRLKIFRSEEDARAWLAS